MDNLIDIGLNLMHTSFKKDRKEVIDEAIENGVNKFIITGTQVTSSQTAAEYAADYPGVLYTTAGVHPHDTRHCSRFTIDTLESIASRDCVVAIGECGLDYNRDFSPRATQKEWFEKQVELAEKIDMPLFLHERDAHNDLYNILKKHEGIAEKSVIHCFTGNKRQAQEFVDLGCYIGVTGWICDDRRGGDLQKAVKVIPDDKLMIETDAPFLIPRDFEVKPKKNRNEPKYLPHILKTIASYRDDEDVEALAAKVTKNTKEFFNI